MIIMHMNGIANNLVANIVCLTSLRPASVIWCAFQDVKALFELLQPVDRLASRTFHVRQYLDALHPVVAEAPTASMTSDSIILRAMMT